MAKEGRKGRSIPPKLSNVLRIEERERMNKIGRTKRKKAPGGEEGSTTDAAPMREHRCW